MNSQHRDQGNPSVHLVSTYRHQSTVGVLANAATPEHRLILTSELECPALAIRPKMEIFRDPPRIQAKFGKELSLTIDLKCRRN